jgi:hypothetical protein
LPGRDNGMKVTATRHEAVQAELATEPQPFGSAGRW